MVFSSAVEGRGWGVLPCLLLLLLSLLPLCCSTPTPSQLHSPIQGGAAVRAVVREVHGESSDCSVVVFTDHTAIAQAVVKDMSLGYAPGGITLLQLPDFAKMDESAVSTNTSVVDQHLTKLMKIGRKVRFFVRCLAVLFVTDSEAMLRAMLRHSTDDRVMLWKTSGIIVTSLSESSALAVAEQMWAFTMMNCIMLVLRHDAEGSALVLRHEPYSPVGRRTRVVGFYTARHGLSTVRSFTAPKFDNFYGAPINFTTLPYLPFSGVKTFNHPNGTKTYGSFSGVDYEFLVLLGEKLNFSLNYIRTANWDEVTAEVTKRNSFIATCYYFVYMSRLEEYDYIAPYMSLELSFLMRTPTIVASWDSFLWPFYMNVWLSTLVALVVLAMSFVMVLKYSSTENVISSKLRGGQQSTGVGTITKTRALFEVFGAIIGQDFTFKMPNTHSFRVLLIASFLFIIVLSTGYKSNLIAFMTSPKIPATPQTIRELVESKTVVTFPKWGNHFQKLLKNFPAEDHRKIGKDSILIPNIIAGFEMARKHGTAHVQARPYMSYVIAKNHRRADGSTDFYIGRENVFAFMASLPIPLDAPFKPQFDDAMINIIKSGLYYKWHANEIEKLRISKAGEESNKALTLDNLQGPFWILLCGSGLSMLGCLVEMVWVRLNRDVLIQKPVPEK